MEVLNQWGIGLILWLQSINSGLDLVVKTLNFGQTEEFFLIALPIVWWCINKRVGASLAILFLTTDYIARVLKGITAVPRPYDVDPRLRNLDPQSDLSFPSAGALDTTIFWGFCAIQARRRVVWIAAIIAVIVIALTRVYLAAHYPTDVLASILIGAIVLLVVAQSRVIDQLAAASQRTGWALAVIFPIALALIRLNQETATSLGAMLGFGIGLILEEQHIRFEPQTSLGRQVLKVAIGLAVGLGLRLALKPVLPPGDWFTLIRYAVIGFWMAAGAPWVFVTARLAKTHPSERSQVTAEALP